MQEINTSIRYWIEIGEEDNSTFIEVFPTPKLYVKFDKPQRRKK